MIDEKALEAAAAALGGDEWHYPNDKPRFRDDARRAITAYLQALSPGSTGEAEGAPAAWAEEYGGRIVSVALKQGAFHKTPLYRAMLSAAGER